MKTKRTSQQLLYGGHEKVFVLLSPGYTVGVIMDLIDLKLMNWGDSKRFSLNQYYSYIPVKSCKPGIAFLVMPIRLRRVKNCENPQCSV